MFPRMPHNVDEFLKPVAEMSVCGTCSGLGGSYVEDKGVFEIVGFCPDCNGIGKVKYTNPTRK